MFAIRICVLVAIGLFRTWLAVAQGYSWADNAGGNNSDAGTGIAKDAAGNIYITGFFGSGSASFGTINLTGSGIQNLFAAKYDGVTGDCLWAVKADGFIYTTGIDVASNGDIYMTGYLNGTNSFGTLTVTATGIYDVFVAKMDSSGMWQWVTTAGGIGAGNQDYGNAVLADGSGNVYVTGTFGNTIHFGGTTLTSFGGDDIFVAKLNSTGTWQWSKQFGAAAIDDGNGLTVDANGNIYGTGCFSGTVSFGSTTLTSNGGTEDIYVCKLDTSGNSLWAIKAGGSTPDYGNALQRDGSGNLFVTGWFSTTAFFGPSSVTTLGGNEVFVARCDSNGVWQWAASGGTGGIDIAYDIALDDQDDSYLTGYVNAGYPVIFGNDTINIVSDYSDIFMAKCDSSGIWQWLTVNGSASWDVGYGIVVENCSEYVTGYFSLEVDFDSIPLTAAGNTSDAFIGKYIEDPSACGIQLTPDPFLCEKFCINFFDPSTNSPTAWQWVFPGGTPSSSTDQNPESICYNNPGTFDVTLITTNATGNDTVFLPGYVTVYPTPPPPLISQNGNTLTSSLANTYQWQLNSVDIPGATNQSYDVIQSGYYTVYITDGNGCSSNTTIYVVITGIENFSDDSWFAVYPNPSTGKIFVKLSALDLEGEISIDVMDVLGRKIISMHQEISSPGLLIPVDLKRISGDDLPAGIYFVEVKRDQNFSDIINQQERKKIMISK